MIIECQKCHLECILPCHMGCGHVYCFLCLNDALNCISCNANTGFMPNNLSGTKKYIWLYSSNHPKMWWCYDNANNNTIEQLYQSTITSMGNNNVKLSFTNEKKDDKHQTQQIVLPPFSFVNTTDNSNLDVSFTDDHTVNNVNQNTEYVSSIIKIANQYYDIDLNKMCQINMLDKTKKRKIKRIEVPDSVSKGNMPGIKKYLSDLNILGISGKQFEFK